ncbi:MAG: hypothetical protein J3R72DRAFT_454075 [Linnemannia gamsii]|nr:MAG: hypothetical protein J3R72DRAFT_454075 [Linnemannia gamsii]
MLAIFLYSVASLLLPLIIINAKEPVIDFSQLVPPTTTTFPPAPVPVSGVGHSSYSSSSVPQDMNNVVFVAPPSSSSKFASFLDHILPTKNSRSSSSPSFFSLSSYRPRRWRSSPKRHSTSTSHRAATKRVAGQDGWEVEEKPYKSRYSPRAGSSAGEYDAYGFRQNASYNKSESCSKDQAEQSQQGQREQQPEQKSMDKRFQVPNLDDWRAPMQHIALPIKP